MALDVGWILTIRRLPSAGFWERGGALGVGWKLTIHRLPSGGFEGKANNLYAIEVAVCSSGT